jgi:hypothetical protein
MGFSRKSLSELCRDSGFREDSDSSGSPNGVNQAIDIGSAWLRIVVETGDDRPDKRDGKLSTKIGQPIVICDE